MGVDGIGSGGSRPLAGIERPEAVEAPGVGRVGDASRPAAPAPVGSAALQRLERGEISVDAYVDQRVIEATQHLEGQLPATEIAFVRDALREQISLDPVLAELVRRTTGQVPTRDG